MIKIIVTCIDVLLMIIPILACFFGGYSNLENESKVTVLILMVVPAINLLALWLII